MALSTVVCINYRAHMPAAFGTLLTDRGLSLRLFRIAGDCRRQDYSESRSNEQTFPMSRAAERHRSSATVLILLFWDSPNALAPHDPSRSGRLGPTPDPAQSIAQARKVIRQRAGCGTYRNNGRPGQLGRWPEGHARPVWSLRIYAPPLSRWHMHNEGTWKPVETSPTHTRPAGLSLQHPAHLARRRVLMCQD